MTPTVLFVNVRRTILLLGAAAAIFFSTESRAADQTDSTIYDPDPNHLWNRLNETLFVRKANDGQKYGRDDLDILFWSDTDFLLLEPSHSRAVAVLDEFIKSHGEKLIHDPIERALLQRSLWALFDWSASPWRGAHVLKSISRDFDPAFTMKFERKRTELQSRLAIIIQRLALTPAQIESLPDNYAEAEKNNLSPNLPRGLFSDDGGWITLGNIAPLAHTHKEYFGGRSVFIVKVRLPEGRKGTLDYLQQLRSFAPLFIADTNFPSARLINPELPQFPANTQWALIRRMCVIDTEGHMRPTRMTESIQVRRYVKALLEDPVAFSRQSNFSNSEQAFIEFQLDRSQRGKLREITKRDSEFVLFNSLPGDQIELAASLRRPILDMCIGCHSQRGILSVASINRGSDAFIPLDITEFSPIAEVSGTISWKQQQYDWGLLQGLWRQAEQSTSR